MTEEERKMFTGCLTETVKCATDIVYGTLAIMFESLAKHPELTLQEVLATMAVMLRESCEKEKKNNG